MNLFRSEEHIRNWAQFNPDSEQGIVSMVDLVKLFSCELFKRRMDLDYLSRRREFIDEFWGILFEMGKTRSFWSPPQR